MTCRIRTGRSRTRTCRRSSAWSTLCGGCSSASSVAERLRLWLERGERGYHLRDAETEALVRWEDPRIRVVPVAGVSYRPGALDDPSFDPGRRLALVPEPDNPHDGNAVAIYNEARTLQLGYVPAAV